VTLDTWRWDYIGVSGSGRVQTPNLDRLAKEGIYEPEAVTPCPLTTPAHASIMTGLAPMRHRVWDCTVYPLPGGIPTLAESFRTAGFTTAAFVASETLNRRYGLHRGFGRYDDVAMKAGTGKGDWGAASRDGAAVTDSFLAFLRTSQTEAPIFAWLHYYDAHLPYRPRPAFDGRYPKDPYASQVAFLDAEMGRVLSALKGDSRKWRVAVVGDHGEGLGDRGEATHGIGLYRSTLHVPFILHPKPEKALLHPKPWGLVDVMPTLLEWYGFTAVPDRDGETLFTRGAPQRALYAVSLLPTLFFSVEPSLGIRRGPRFYLRHSVEELFDLEADPGQARDVHLSQAELPALEALRALCDRQWPKGWFSRLVPMKIAGDSEEMNNLRSLGYISGAVPSLAKIRSADIRQVMKDHSDWEVAREEENVTGKKDRLLPLYPGLLARYPDSFALRKDYGTYLGKAGRDREAIDQLEKAVRIFPRDAVVLENLGALYLHQGRSDAARVALERSVEIDPGRPGAQKNLGLIYLDYLKQPEKAIPHFKKYLEAGGDSESERVRAFVMNYEKSGAGKAP
jgi:arylsulfatase A-like enzyme